MHVDTAVVLAGGPGTRLKPLTNNLPKAMIPVCGKPLLQWVIEWLRDNGVSNLVVGVAYLKKKIMDHFSNGQALEVDITYSVHSVEGGTGEGFRLAIDRYVRDDVFIAMNGDQITDLTIRDIVDFHVKSDPIVTIAVANPRCPFGHVQRDEHHNVLGFVEKPLCPNSVCSTGIYVFDRDVMNYLPKSGSVEDTTFPALTKLNLVKAYPFNGFFTTVNTAKDLIEAEQQLRRRHQ